MTVTLNTVACANRAVHGTNHLRQAHHRSVAEVRECFTTPGGVLSVEEQQVQSQAQQYAERVTSNLPNPVFEPTDVQVEDFMTRMRAEFLSVEAGPSALLPQPQPQAEPEPVQEVEETLTEQERYEAFPDGIYTVEMDGDKHYTFKVRTQAEDDKFAPGQRVMSYLSGPNNESDYTSFAFVSDQGRVNTWTRFRDNRSLVEAAKALARSPREAMEAGHCYKCHRLLTTPESVAAGIGPTCAGKA